MHLCYEIVFLFIKLVIGIYMQVLKPFENTLAILPQLSSITTPSVFNKSTGDIKLREPLCLKETSISWGSDYLWTVGDLTSYRISQEVGYLHTSIHPVCCCYMEQHGDC